MSCALQSCPPNTCFVGVTSLSSLVCMSDEMARQLKTATQGRRLKIRPGTLLDARRLCESAKHDVSYLRGVAGIPSNPVASMQHHLYFTRAAVATGEFHDPTQTGHLKQMHLLLSAIIRIRLNRKLTATHAATLRRASRIFLHLFLVGNEEGYDRRMHRIHLGW